MKFQKHTGNTIIIWLSVIAFIINIIMGGGNRFWIFLTGGGNLMDYGHAQYDLVFVKYQFWRLVSCGYLHMGILHLGFNLYALCCLGNIVEERLGTIRYLLVYHIIMILTVSIWCMLFREVTIVGASSGIFALVGFFLIQSLLCEKKIWEQLPNGKRKYIIGYSVIGNFISPYTAALHAISFLMGVIYGLAKRDNTAYSDVRTHYDKLIDEGNDPVHDSEPLKKYMDNWDGQQFINDMQLSGKEAVLEIGVGTGRLAIKVCGTCHEFYGIDISSKTIETAQKNLSQYSNVHLIRNDYLEWKTDEKFDVIYSSLTFLHIKDKEKAIEKTYALLNENGRFVLSIDKSQDDEIVYDMRKVKTYPDNVENIERLLNGCGFIITKQYETEFAYIFVSEKVILPRTML